MYMVYNYIITVFISILIIAFAHYSYKYLRDNLTQNKTKDLAGFQSRKLNELMEELREIKENKRPPVTDMADELLEFAQLQERELNNI